MTKQFNFTSAQVQNFIYLCEGEDSPILLQDFYERNFDAVYKKTKNWVLELNYTAIKFLLKELKDYVVFLEQEIVNYKTKKDLSCYYPMYNRIRITLAKRVIEKLS